MNNPETIGIGSVIQAAVDTANKMCNPDLYRFEWDELDEVDIVVNETLGRGTIEDRQAYCGELAEIVCGILNRYEEDGWYVHSEANYWDKDGNELHYWDRGDVATVQYQIMK